MKFLQTHFLSIAKFIIFTFLSIAIRGYQYGSGNHVHYFNFAFHKYYPEFFSSDYLFKIHDLPYTIFVDFIYMVLIIFGENTFIFFIIYFIFLFLFYLSIYLITNFFFKNRKLSYLMLLFFISPFPIGGSTIDTLDESLMPRFVAEIFLLFSIYFLLLKKNILSPVVAGMGFLFHPITMVPYIPIVILSEIFENRHSFSLKKVSKIASSILKPVTSKILIFLLIASPILFKFIQNQSGSTFIDEQWRSVLIERLPYIFIWQWSIINFLMLFAICIYFIVYERIYKRKINATVKAILVVSILFFITAFISSVFNFRLGLQLQLARNLYLLVIFTIIYGIGSFLTRVSESNLKKIAIVILLVSVLLCFPARKDYGLLWINPLDDYQKAAIWAKNNTSNDSLFLVPLDGFGFRFWSKRSVFLEQKEGGDSLYDRSFAMEWNKREELIKKNQRFNKNYIIALKKEYKIDYIVTTQDLPGLTVLYKNNTYIIYKI